MNTDLSLNRNIPFQAIIKTLNITMGYLTAGEWWLYGGYKVLDYKSFQWLNGSKETE